MNRDLTLSLIGGALVAAGLYEALSSKVGRPSITEIGGRFPEIPGALIGSLIAHFFIERRAIEPRGSHRNPQG